MRVEIYQLKNDIEALRDLRFESYQSLIESGKKINAENYECIYACDREDDTSPEDIFEEFNINIPDDYRGHSLSVSDVVVLVKNGNRYSHYVDSFGFVELDDFKPELLTGLYIPAGEPIGEVIEIPGDLAAMQYLVGGRIEVCYPPSHTDFVIIICNEEGKLDGLPLTRAVRDKTGEIYDIIAGPMVLFNAYPENSNFDSLTEFQIARYKKMYKC